MGSDSSQKKKIAIIGVSSILLVAAVVGTVTYGVSRNNNNVNQVSTTSSNKAVQTVCGVTDYKGTCEKSLSNATDNMDIKQLIQVALKASIESVRGVINSSAALSEAAKNPSVSEAFRVCNESLDLSIYTLEKSIDKINVAVDKDNFEEFMDDLKTWLSGTISFQEVCLDAFDNSTGETGEKVKELMKTTRELSSNGLAMITELSHVISGLEIPATNSRRLLENGMRHREGISDDYYPPDARRLLDNEKVEKMGLLENGNGETSIRHRQGISDDYYPPDATRLLDNEKVEKIGLLQNGNGETPIRHRQGISDDYYPPDATRLLDNEKAVKMGLSDDYYPPDARSRRLLDNEKAEKMGLFGDYYPPDARSRRLLDNKKIKKPAAYDYYDGEPPIRKLLNEDAKTMSMDHSYVREPRVQRLLGAQPHALKPNAVVSLDGRGQFKSIQAAINTAPKKVNQTFVILVKAGIYREYVEIPKYVYNILLIGEGPTKTRITGHKNFVDGTGTWYTATVGVNGDNFIARDIAFENSAGAIKHQAVALRVSADKAVFFNCHMDGYQDTLYTVSGRQFFRDCQITGTVDFIFGDAASVFQNCRLVVRKPMEHQSCMVTAQGRNDPRSNGATVFQNCAIVPAPDYFTLKPAAKAFLGRPWKQYSRTLIMQSFIDGFIAPEGWSEWTGTFALDTLKYGEYANRGPGSNTARRVKWKGIQHITPAIAQSFTVGPYLSSRQWLMPTGIPYEAGMMRV